MVRRLILLYLFWTVWKGLNNRIVEGPKQTSLEVKNGFLKTLFLLMFLEPTGH